MANLRFDRDALTEEQRNKSTWPTVDVASLNADDAALFLRRCRAFRDYIDGKRYSDIRREYGITSTSLWTLRVRFFTQHRDGRIYGERAFVPRARIKSYERRREIGVRPQGARGGLSGALGALFERFPEVKTLVDEQFLKRAKPGVVYESRIAVKGIHKRFLDRCRSLGIRNSYPFTTKWRGERALRKYLVRLAAEHTERTIEVRFGKNAARKYLATGEGAAADVTRPYQRVICDGHKIDGHFIIRVKHPYVGEVPVVSPRIWIIAMQDVFTRAILSWVLVISLEYGARDVTRCVQRALVPWKPRTLTIPGLRYPEQGGYPSDLGPEYAWVAWDEFWIDNAKANLAEITLEALIAKVRTKVHAGAINAIERRALIERFFLTFEENGVHRLASTTGSHPNDPRRQEPEKAALRYDIRLDHLEELIEVMIAQYNTTPHTALGYGTPLEVLERYVATGGTLRYVAEKYRNDAEFLYERAVRTVRGSLKRSRRPYIEFEGAVYRNEILSRSPELIGQKLALHVNPDDVRCIKAFLPDGNELGILTAAPPWHRTPHSLDTRRAINSQRHKKLIAFTEMDDPIAAYGEQLGREALVKKRARPKYERHRRETEAAAANATPVVADVPTSTDKVVPFGNDSARPQSRQTITY